MDPIDYMDRHPTATLIALVVLTAALFIAFGVAYADWLNTTPDYPTLPATYAPGANTPGVDGAGY